MRILITGASGFIGQRLLPRLQRDGHTLFTFSDHDGDLAEQGALDAVSRVDYVYHLAARTFVPASWDDPYAFYRTNVMGAVTALEFCRRHACPITLMSTYVYGEPQYLPVDETHPLSSPSPYHQTKQLCESLGAFYAAQYRLPVTVFRPFNIYGPGQRDGFLIPSIVNQLRDPLCKEIVVKDLTPKRDYVYVDDVTEILARACTMHSDAYEAYNIGSGVSLSVEEVICAVMRSTGVHKPYRSLHERRPGEISDCAASTDKVKKAFAMERFCSFEEGLTRWIHDPAASLLGRHAP